MFADHWGGTIAGQLGGSYFNFNDPGGSGNVEEVLWSARVGLDWVLPHEDREGITYFGVGYEYAEAKSWLENQLLSESGPRNVLTGAFVRTGRGWRLSSWLLLTGELEASGFRGRADVPSTLARYNWFGRSIGASLALRFVGP